MSRTKKKEFAELDDFGFEVETEAEQYKDYSDILNHISRRSVDDLYIDPDIIPHGMVYHWVSNAIYKSGDVPLSNNLSKVAKSGWTPVPSERHPELSSRDPLDRDSHLREYIYNQGLILCERPKFIDDKENEMRKMDANRAMNCIQQYVVK